MRQNIRFDPAVKLFEAYSDFSGGLNSESSNERLRDNEVPVMDNIDLSGRGSIRRRTGRSDYIRNQLSGKGQGLFHYYREDQLEPDIIYAVSGKLYIAKPVGIDQDSAIIIKGQRVDEFLAPGQTVYLELTCPVSGDYTFQTQSNMNLKMEIKDYNGVQLAYDDDSGDGDNPLATVNLTAEQTYYVKLYGFDGSVTGPYTLQIIPPNETILPYDAKPEYKSKSIEIPITGLPDGFQKDLPIEAAQYKDLLFIATGTKLVEYDGTTAKVVEPYKPSAMEAIYIGTNGLADNPDAYIQDQEAANLSVAIKPQKRSGVVNVANTLTAFVSKPASITSVDYKWEYRKVGETTWVMGKDFAAANKAWDWTPTSTGKYEIRCTIRNTSVTSQTAEYIVTNYPVNDVEDKANQILPVDSINTCRKIILHWDRLILAKDEKYPHQMYISDLNNPRYFPTTNSINFDANKQEPITAMVRYRDMLVVFTKTTIQALAGKSPSDYRRAQIHDGIGCVSDRTAHVIGNHIVFLSDEGVQMLAPSTLTLDTLNVKKIDRNIKSLVQRDENACAMVYDNQYWLCLPAQSVIYRYYYDGGVWVRDKSSKLNIVDFLKYQGQVYEITYDGKLYKQNKLVYSDVSEVYKMQLDSKYLDLSATFNQKKLKRLYILAKHFPVSVNLKVYVYADSAIVLNPDSGHAVVMPDGYVEWLNTTEPNFKFHTGTVMGEWILGTSPLGDVQLSVQRASVRGKCRRVKVSFVHDEDTPCEIYAFGLEFKAKKP